MTSTRFPGSFRDFQRKDMVSKKCKVIRRSTKVEGLMVTVTIHCPHCGSEEIKRNGHAPNGKQKYSCRACKRQSRENPTPNVYPEERREEILRAYEERSSLRGIERTFRVSRASVISWIKKSSKTADLERNTDGAGCE
jgi:transposase-like protein